VSLFCELDKNEVFMDYENNLISLKYKIVLPNIFPAQEKKN